MNIQFNKSGTPLLAVTKTVMVVTKGGPTQTKDTPAENISPLVVDEKKIVRWGDQNNYPEIAESYIKKSSVLNSGLRYKMMTTVAQGIYAAKQTGFDEEGNDVLERVDDVKLQRSLRDRKVFNYLVDSLRDIFKFGVCFPELIFSADGNSIDGINVINARFCRLTNDKQFVAYSENWEGMVALPTKENTKFIPVLDAYDPLADLIRLRKAGLTAGKSYIYPLFNRFSNNVIYPLPDWDTARQAGWLDISQEVPNFLKNVYKNQASLTYIVRIPYSYWDKNFPLKDYPDNKERRELIAKEIKKIEDTLTGTDNAKKTLISHFAINDMGKAEEKWDVEVLDDKFKSDQQLITSAAANSEVLFSILVNPTEVGAMPSGGGPYATSAGGSNIREAFLVTTQLAWINQQHITYPIEHMLVFNGHSEDNEIRFKKTILTTLDTGAGTKKVS
jgi:hypothetical protein